MIIHDLEAFSILFQEEGLPKDRDYEKHVALIQ